MLKKRIVCGALLACLAGSEVVLAAEPLETKTIQENFSDAKITTKIKALYLMSPLVKAFDISVSTTDGAVVLAGKVTTDQEYERAITIANSVEGVKSLNVEKLEVLASKSPIADTLITAKVKAKFLQEKLFGDKAIEFWPVGVETKNGVVYLTGNVKTNEEQDTMLSLAKSVKGVESVRSSITVGQ